LRLLARNDGGKLGHRSETEALPATEDNGFGSPKHRELPARTKLKSEKDVTQSQQHLQTASAWSEMPAFKDQKCAWIWVHSRLELWTNSTEEHHELRTRFLFELEREQSEPLVNPNINRAVASGAQGAELDSGGEDERVADVDSSEDETDKDTSAPTPPRCGRPPPAPAPDPYDETEADSDVEEEEEQNRNAFTEEVEMGQDVEYVEGVDDAGQQRIGEQYWMVEIVVASEKDLQDYNDDKSTGWLKAHVYWNMPKKVVALVVLIHVTGLLKVLAL